MNLQNQGHIALKLKVVNSITEISSEEWDRLEIRNPLNLHGWLLTMEQCSIDFDEIRYFILYHGQKILCHTFAMLFSEPASTNQAERTIYSTLAKYFKRIGLSISPVLYAGHNRADGTSISFHGDLNDQLRSDYLQQLVKLIKEYCRSHRYSLCFARFHNRESIENSVLRKLGFHRYMNYCTAVMDIEWKDLDGYKNFLAKYLGKRYKYDAIRELNKNQNAGVQYSSIDHANDVTPILYKLLVDNHKKYYDSTFYYKPDFLSKLIHNLGSNVLVEVANKENKLFGLSIRLKSEPYHYLLFICVDHSVSKGDMTYFVMCYYRPALSVDVEEIKQIMYGTAILKVKKVRGCKIIRSYDYVWHHQPLKNFLIGRWVPIRDHIMKRKKGYALDV